MSDNLNINWVRWIYGKLLKILKYQHFLKNDYYILCKKRWVCINNKIIEVQNVKVNIANINDNDYICISDYGKLW